MGQPVENTLHDLRWGDFDQSGTTDDYVWVFEISGSVPPAQLIGGWAGATGERQPGMYFRLGGSTIKGISRPGEIVWSRVFIADGKLNLDIGRAKVIELPLARNAAPLGRDHAAMADYACRHIRRQPRPDDGPA